ncbi:MAG TPA: hypothetical protein VL492_09295 [Methylovirgula sp.]|jgi:hypothetical protein|nr:hypothetical protein [Methylovirgula sp.]
MVGFTFSAEQIKAAPPEVRRWMESEIVKALAGGFSVRADDAAQTVTPSPETVESLRRALASGTASEMQDTFKRVSGNSIVARVFFELARDTGLTAGGAPLHVVNIVDVMRHVQFVEAQQVLTCLDAINQAFQQVRRDPQASLFALDDAGHIFLHELTYHGIRQMWQQQVLSHPWPASGHMAQAPASTSAPPSGRQEPSVEPIMRPEHAFSGPPRS